MYKVIPRVVSKEIGKGIKTKEISVMNPIMTNDCEALGLLYIAAKVKREGFDAGLLDPD